MHHELCVDVHSARTSPDHAEPAASSSVKNIQTLAPAFDYHALSYYKFIKNDIPLKSVASLFGTYY